MTKHQVSSTYLITDMFKLQLFTGKPPHPTFDTPTKTPSCLTVLTIPSARALYDPLNAESGAQGRSRASGGENGTFVRDSHHRAVS